MDICNVLDELLFSCQKGKIEEKVNLKSDLPEDLKTEPWTVVTCLYCSKAFKSLFPSSQRNISTTSFREGHYKSFTLNLCHWPEEDRLH